MDIKDIIKQYGFNDYYEMSTGRIFQLSETKYEKARNISSIPVLEDNNVIGNIELSGNIREEMES